MTVAADYHEPGMGNDRRCLENVIGNEPGRDAVQALASFHGPHFGAEQTQAHLNESVVQVN